jgi:hypothetical protein
MNTIYYLNILIVQFDVIKYCSFLLFNQSLGLCILQNWSCVPVKNSPFPSPPRPWQLPFYFLLITIDTHVRRIIVVFFFCFLGFFFCEWLISFSIVFLRFIHVIACVRISLLFMSEKYSIVHIYYILFICQYTFELLSPFDYCEYCS